MRDRDPGGGRERRRATTRPGRPRTAMPASRSASASSPPRPKTNGSPPFSRTTSRPAPAEPTSSSLTAACVERRRAQMSERVRRGLGDELGSDEAVVDEHVAAADELEPARRDQARVARAGADEVRRSCERLLRRGRRSSRAAPRRSAKCCLRPGPQLAQPRGERRRARAGRPAAISSRSRCASAGEAPPVETATAIGSCAVHGREDEASRARARRRRCRGARGPRRRRRRPVDGCRRTSPRRRGSGRRGRSAGTPRRSTSTGSAASSGETSGATTVTARPAVEQPAHLLERDPAAADDEHTAAVEVEAGHVVALLGPLRRRSTRVGRRCRSSRTATSTPPATRASEYMPGPIASIRNESSGRPLSVASASVTARALSVSSAPRGQPAVEAERGLLAARAVERADPAGLEAELEQLARAPPRPRRRPRPPRPRGERRPAGARCPRRAPSRARPAPRRARPRAPRRRRRRRSIERSSPRIACSSCSKPPVSIAQWMPHSFGAFVSHHQRPARVASPGAIARVQGAQPIEV